MIQSGRILSFFVAALLAIPSSGQASEISLSNIVQRGAIADFEVLAADIGEALGQKRIGPAASLGGLGFDVSLEVSSTLIDSESSAWRDSGLKDEGALTSVQLQMRKGLPYSFEIGGAVTYMPVGDMWGIGVGLKYAFVEGYRYSPDMALRVSVSTVLGNRDLNMLMFGVDYVLSKSFGVGGTVSLTPYVGYSLLFVRATTNVVGYFEEGATSPSFNLFPISNVLRHRASLGIDVKVAMVSVGVEALLSGVSETITARVGVDF